MQHSILKSKIHRARITDAHLDYEGSLSIDLDLMAAAGIVGGERLLVVNATCGSRLETYAIPAEAGSGTICLNGAAARLGQPGDVVTIMTFALIDDDELDTHEPKVIILNAQNAVIETKAGPRPR